MIEFDGISFNEMISRRIMGELAGHDPTYAELAQDQVPNRVTRFSFMAAVAKINGLVFFPKVAEFCDGTLHAVCDSTVMTRGFFAPLCLAGDNKLIVAIANPWSPLAEEYLAPRFPDLEIIKVVTLASEIGRAIDLLNNSASAIAKIHRAARRRQRLDVQPLKQAVDALIENFSSDPNTLFWALSANRRM